MAALHVATTSAATAGVSMSHVTLSGLGSHVGAPVPVSPAAGRACGGARGGKEGGKGRPETRDARPGVRH